MATPLVLKNSRIFASGVDLTGYSNKVEVSGQVEVKDATTFLPASDPNSGWKKVLGGIASGKISGGGNWEGTTSLSTLGALDDTLFSGVGTVIPISVYGDEATEGNPGYFTSSLVTSYQFLGAIGDVAPWTVDDDSAWPVIRGVSLEAPGTARTANGNGTPIQIGAVGASQRLYAALHVLSVAGTATPTLTVKVQSDTVGFPSPADQITFTAATAVGGQIARTAVGPITDDYYRISFTITGTNPSFLFVVSAGIGPA